MSVYLKPDEVLAYFKSLKAVSDAIKSISLQDAYDLANAAKEELKRHFPQSTPVTGRYYDKGSHSEQTRTTHLATGWRVYPTSLNSSPAYLIQHVRFNDLRIRTILAAIDQGSRAHWIVLRRAKAFRFAKTRVSGPDPVIVAGSEGQTQRIRIPRRDPQPYIVPTQEFIARAMQELALERARDIEDVYARKTTRLNRLKASYAQILANKLTDQ